MRNIVVASLVLAALPAASVSAQQVSLLANQTHLAANGTTTAQVQATVGPYATDALILVSAQGKSRFDGRNGSSHGIVVEIHANGLILEDDSFEGKSYIIAYRAAVSHSFVLKRGTTRVVKARTRPYGAGAGVNNTTRISMDLAAIAVS